MDAKLKKKWIKALRSGKYKQCKGNLRQGETFCCLGVLAHQADMKFSRQTDGIYTPKEHRHSYDPIWNLVGESFGRELSGMNDGGASFSKIADYIEKNL